MKKTKVSVIIVTYKSAELTVNCIDSISKEKVHPEILVDVIVVDNASGDAPYVSKAIEERHWGDWVTLIEAPKNGGFAYGNNLGFRKAWEINKPDYFHLLNPDTCVREGAISSLVKFMEVNPKVGIAGSSFENKDGSNWPYAFKFPTALSEFESGLNFGPLSKLLQRWVVAKKMKPVEQEIDWIPGASMMVRSKVIESVGGLDENYFLYFEETEFCHRAKKAGFPTWYVPQSRVMHIAGQSTKVTVRDARPQRLPAYWFESRRRFFSIIYGPGYALLADLLSVVSHALGAIKCAIKREPRVPSYISDIISHSIIWRENRALAPVETFQPPKGG